LLTLQALLLNTTLAKEEIKIVDQNRLDFLIACIQKDELATLFIHTTDPTIAYNPNSTGTEAGNVFG
jgi:hypothetical protein